MILASDVLTREDDTDRLIQLVNVGLDECNGDRAGRLDHDCLRLKQVFQCRANFCLGDQGNLYLRIRDRSLHL